MRLYDNAASANGYKLRLVLGLLGRTCAIEEVDIFSGHSRTPEFLARNPAGRVPVLALDDGTWLPESNAILCYLAMDTPLWPASAIDRAQVLRWLSFEQYEIEPVIGTARFWMLTGRDRGREHERDAKRDQGARSLAGLEQHLAARATPATDATRPTFLVGDALSVADLAIYAYGHLAPEAGIALDAYPRLRRLFAHIEALPGFIPGPAPYPPHARV